MNIVKRPFSKVYRFLFSDKGRLGRAGFAAGLITKTVLVILLSIKINHIENTIIESVAFLCLVIPVYMSYAALITRRCHDFGEKDSRYEENKYLIPIIGTIFVFDELLFRPGCAGKNKYGHPPTL